MERICAPNRAASIHAGASFANFVCRLFVAKMCVNFGTAAIVAVQRQEVQAEKGRRGTRGTVLVRGQRDRVEQLCNVRECQRARRKAIPGPKNLKEDVRTSSPREPRQMNNPVSSPKTVRSAIAHGTISKAPPRRFTDAQPFRRSGIAIPNTLTRGHCLSTPRRQPQDRPYRAGAALNRSCGGDKAARPPHGPLGCWRNRPSIDRRTPSHLPPMLARRCQSRKKFG